MLNDNIVNNEKKPSIDRRRIDEARNRMRKPIRPSKL